MKISLSTENALALNDLRTKLAKELKIVTDATGDLEAMKREEVKRNDEVDKIERGVVFDDTKGVQTLETKRAQLGILRRRIDRVEDESAPIMEDLRLCLESVHQVMAPALEPAWRENVIECARMIHPFVGNWAISIQTSARFFKHIHFANAFMQRRYGGHGDLIGPARQVLTYLDALLVGKLPISIEIEPIPDPMPYLFPWER